MHDNGNLNEAEFGVFDPSADVERSGRYLPHWFQPGTALFVTFRTADSMPREVVLRWRNELDAWLRERSLTPNSLTGRDASEYHRLRQRLWHRSLDNCHGACELKDPQIAQVVADTLLHFDSDRYDLDSFVIMPNHVHLIVQMRGRFTLRQQAESWLRFSARRINEHYGRTGKFWQSEPFDHLIRSSEQFDYLQRYIAENPIKANLKQGEFKYWKRTVARLSESCYYQSSMGSIQMTKPSLDPSLRCCVPNG